MQPVARFVVVLPVLQRWAETKAKRQTDLVKVDVGKNNNKKKQLPIPLTAAM